MREVIYIFFILSLVSKSEERLSVIKPTERQGRRFIPTLTSRQIVNFVKSSQDFNQQTSSQNQRIQTTKEYYDALLSYLQRHAKAPDPNAAHNVPTQIQMSNVDIQQLANSLREALETGKEDPNKDGFLIPNEDFPSLISLLNSDQVTPESIAESLNPTQPTKSPPSSSSSSDEYSSVPFFPAVHGDDLRNSPIPLPTSSIIKTASAASASTEPPPVPVRSGLSSLLSSASAGSFSTALENCRMNAACLLAVAVGLSAAFLSPFAISVGGFKKRRKRSISFENDSDNSHILEYIKKSPDKVRYVNGYVVFDDDPNPVNNYRIWKRSVDDESKTKNDQANKKFEHLNETPLTTTDIQPSTTENENLDVINKLESPVQLDFSDEKSNDKLNSIEKIGKNDVIRKQLLSLLSQFNENENQFSGPLLSYNSLGQTHNIESNSKNTQQTRIDEAKQEDTEASIDNKQLVVLQTQTDENGNKFVVIPENYFQVLNNQKENHYNHKGSSTQQTIVYQSYPVKPSGQVEGGSNNREPYFGISLNKDPTNNQNSGKNKLRPIQSSPNQGFIEGNTGGPNKEKRFPPKGIASLSLDLSTLTSIKDNHKNIKQDDKKSDQNPLPIRSQKPPDTLIPFHALRKILEGASGTPNRLFPVMNNLPPLTILSHEPPATVIDKVNQASPPQRFTFAPTIVDAPIPSLSLDSLSTPESESPIRSPILDESVGSQNRKPDQLSSIKVSQEVKGFYSLLCKAILEPDVPLNQITAYIAEKCIVMRYTGVLRRSRKP